MKALIRADASLHIGNGHVMRCISLAKSLHQEGVETVFICRPLPGDLIDYVKAQGFDVLSLPALTSDSITPAEATLAEWQSDAQECIELLAGQHFEWLIVDHYGLDARWHQLMRAHCGQIMVMDDLANRPLDADALVDQNPGRVAEDYDQCLNADIPKFIGPDYALLKPEFAKLRTESLTRRQHADVKHILVSLGGVDINNVTQSVLQALNHADLPINTQVTVVLGQHAPWKAQVEDEIARMSLPARLVSQTEHMAELMFEADVAIGAAGTSALERCCMGLPSLQFVLADNQFTAASALDMAGAAITIAAADDLREPVSQALKHLMTPKHLTDMQTAAASMVDGKGCQRVLNEVMHVG
jgi:UDP-2,4-diacetamido-2,4,6-trideoxy-beta-L-altropyranose hydrolase